MVFKVQLWDKLHTRNCRQIQSVPVEKLCCKIALILFCVFDLNEAAFTLESLDNQLAHYIDKGYIPKSTIVVLVGNKLDLIKDGENEQQEQEEKQSKRSIINSEVKKFMNKYKDLVVEYREVSAKSGENVQETFALKVVDHFYKCKQKYFKNFDEQGKIANDTSSATNNNNSKCVVQ